MTATFLSRVPVAKKLLLLVLIPCLLQAFFVGILAVVMLSAQRELQQIEHQRDALVGLKETAGVAIVALMKIRDSQGISEAAARQELDKVNDAFHGKSGGMTGLDMASFPELKEIIEDAQSMQGELEALLQQAQKNMNTVRKGRKIKRNRLVERTLLVSTILNFQSIAKRIVDAEASYKLSDVERINAIQKNLNTAIFAVLATNALITVVFVYLFTADISRRLKLVADNTHKLAQPAMVQVPCPGADEIAAIDAALREVASRLDEYRRQELAILDNAVDVVFTVDDKLKLQAVNRASRESWGVEPDELLGRNFLSLLTADYRDMAGSQISAILKEENRVEKRVEAALLLPSGNAKTFDVTFSKRTDSSGLTGVARDITQEKAVAALKERLLAIVSHDLRTPLASLSITLSVLVESKRVADPDLRKELSRIDTEVQKVMELTHHLLSLEKQESELANIDMQPVKAYNVWLQIKSALQPVCKERNISLEGPSGDVEIIANEEKLVQAVTIIAKTIFSLSADGTRIVFAIDSDADGGRMRISTGALAAAAAAAGKSSSEVLERFRGLDDENIFDSENISLAIARAILNKHRGQMVFKAGDGAGFEIAVLVPVAEGVC